LYKAQVTTVVREFIGYGCYFAAYEYLVQNHMKKYGITKRNEMSSSWAMLYGAAAGYALWLSIFPLDTIKSKLQVDNLDPSKAKYKGALDCAQKTFAAEGIRGFYRCVANDA
jgi:solute carrier family 25 carnitine/acylcarnitine transporter 20/29